MTSKLTKATLRAEKITFAAGDDGVRQAPEWITLIPAGTVVIARDSRVFVPDHGAAIANFEADGMSIPLDWDHALDSYGVAPGGSPAAAWIDRLEIRDGALCGHIERWTDKGRASVESLEYRYISPVIYSDDQHRVVSVPRASLTNNPALIMPALCSQETTPMNETITELLTDLGLDPTAPTDEAIATVKETFARGKAPAQTVSLEAYIARDQYEAVVAELADARGKLDTYAAQAQAARVETVIKDALTSGRLLPSERPFFEAQAHKDLPEVEKFLASRKPMGQPGPKAVTLQSSQSVLTDAEKAVARKSGLTTEQFAAAKAARQNSLTSKE